MAPHCCAIASAEKSLRGPTTNDRPTPAPPPSRGIGIVTCGNPTRSQTHTSREHFSRHVSIAAASSSSFTLLTSPPFPSSSSSSFAFFAAPGVAPGVVGNTSAAPVPSSSSPTATLASSLARRIVARLSGSIAAHASRSSRARGVIAALVAASHARYHGPISFHASAATRRRWHSRSAASPADRSSVSGDNARATSLSDGQILSRCAPRLIREMPPSPVARVTFANRSPSAPHAAPTAQAAFLSPASSASSTTRSDVGSSELVGVRGALSMSASPTFASVSGSRANQPTVSMLGAWRVTPDALTAPCVGRKP